MTPTLAMQVTRKIEIAEFKSQPKEESERLMK